MTETVAVKIILYVYFFIIGSCVGSFLNVIIYRVPIKEDFVKGRSHCPTCGTTLKPYDIIPVFSWFILKGKCRSCKAKISFRYPLVELLGGLSALLCVFVFGFSLKALTAYIVVAVLIAVSFIDYDTMTIPNSFVIALIIPCVLSLFLWQDITLLQRVIGFFAVSLPMYLITYIKDGAFGGGDIKLMAVCGFLLGWKVLLVAFFIGILTGGVYGIYLLASKNGSMDKHFAFGPFLSFGIVTALFWGQQVLDFYISTFITI